MASSNGEITAKTEIVGLGILVAVIGFFIASAGMYQNIFGVVILTSLGWIGVALVFFGVAILVIGLILKDTDLAPDQTPSPIPPQQIGYVCPQCKTPVMLDYMSCPNCGLLLKKKCPGCGQIVPYEWRVCAYCNTKLPAHKINKG